MAQASYRIWSDEHRAWWRPDSAGYTVHTEAAGLYVRAFVRELQADKSLMRAKRLKVVPIDRPWIVTVETGSPFDNPHHRVMAPTASAARYASFKAWCDAGYGNRMTRREAFLWFSRNMVVRVQRDRSGPVTAPEIPF